MNATSSWVPIDRVVTAEPGPRDVCVVTFIEGVRAAINLVTEYEQARAKAIAFAKETKRPVKLLPVTARELMGFMHVKPSELFGPSADDAEMRQLVVSTCREALRECNDASVRREAFDLLVNMGEPLA